MLLVSVPLLLTWWGRNRISFKKKKKKVECEQVFAQSFFCFSVSPHQIPFSRLLLSRPCSNKPVDLSSAQRARRAMRSFVGKVRKRAREKGGRGAASKIGSIERDKPPSTPFDLLSFCLAFFLSSLSLSHTGTRPVLPPLLLSPLQKHPTRSSPPR